MAHQEFRGFSNPTVPNIWPAPDQMNIGYDEYADIPGALSALVAGEQLLVGEGTFTGSLSRLTVSANISGSGMGVSIWQNIGAEAYAFQPLGVTSLIQNMTFRNNSAANSGAGVSVFSADANLEFRHVEGIGASTGLVGYGFDISNGTVRIIDCKGSSLGSGTNRSINISGGTATILGGYFTNAANISAGTVTIANAVITGNLSITGGTVTLKGPTITGTVTISAGVISQDSYYFDSNGRLISPSTPLWPNPIVNGAFQVWQRGTSFTSVANGAYTADRFIYSKVGTMVHDISRSTNVPTVAEAGVLVPFSFLVDCTTADGTIAAGDLCIIRHYMEGSIWANYAQKQFTVSFWTGHTKTGTYCVAFSNAGGDRTYVGEYTQNVADAWELKRVTVSASPSAGTWDYTTGIGLSVTFTLAAGSTFHTTAGAWQTGNFLSTANQVNGCDNAANNFRLALIDPSPGPFAPLPRLMDIQQERNRCFRYCWVPDASSNTATIFNGAKYATANMIMLGQMPVTMRATPVLTHNITGYTAGAPGTTTIGVFDLGAGGFRTISGALTVSLGAANTQQVTIALDAGTSWSGTAGDMSQMRIGPNVVMVFAPSDYS